MKVELYQRIAHILPAKLVYYCYIRLIAHGTATDEGCKLTPNEIDFDTAIESWERKYGKM